MNLNRHPGLLLALLLGQAAAPAESFELDDREPGPPLPPREHPGRTTPFLAGLVTTSPLRKWRRCPACGGDGPLSWKLCHDRSHPRRPVKTRQVSR